MATQADQTEGTGPIEARETGLGCHREATLTGDPEEIEDLPIVQRCGEGGGAHHQALHRIGKGPASPGAGAARGSGGGGEAGRPPHGASPMALERIMPSRGRMRVMRLRGRIMTPTSIEVMVTISLAPASIWGLAMRESSRRKSSRTIQRSGLHRSSLRLNQGQVSRHRGKEGLARKRRRRRKSTEKDHRVQLQAKVPKSSWAHSASSQEGQLWRSAGAGSAAAATRKGPAGRRVAEMPSTSRFASRRSQQDSRIQSWWNCIDA
mmetsp:Transcript_92207/g.269816  ORF Transcript_92207/g.269816 Transcript_92207/m.269816 type:complete len:264 (+) Transcript_92207:3-794(+)